MKLKLARKPERNGEGSSSLGFTTLVDPENKNFYHQLTYVQHKDGSFSGAYSSQRDLSYFLGFIVIRRKDNYEVQHMTTVTGGAKWLAITMKEVSKRLAHMLVNGIYPNAGNKKQLKQQITKWTEKILVPQKHNNDSST